MIRKMQDADMPAVLDIWLAGNLQAHPFIPADYWQGQLEKMELEYLPSAEVFVYEDVCDGGIKGFIGIVDGSYIAGLFVYPQAQGIGIGKKLLSACQDRYDSLALHVYCDNEKAVRFYDRNGFQVKERGLDEATGAMEQNMIWAK